jgi:hypothetical protein
MHSINANRCSIPGHLTRLQLKAADWVFSKVCVPVVLVIGVLIGTSDNYDVTVEVSPDPCSPILSVAVLHGDC